VKKLDQIFDVFSRRGKPDQPFGYILPSTFRNRVLMLCRDTFSNKYNPHSSDDYTGAFWDDIYQKLTYRHGRPQLTLVASFIRKEIDAANFLTTCKGEEFLDFVEYIFQVECLSRVTYDENTLIEQINQFFALDGLGYELTGFVKEEREEYIFNRPQKVTVIVRYPQVIKKDDQVIHEMAIKPALQFLSDPAFKSANLEYLDALKHYRDGNWGDCLTMCGSSFESVMKIICDKKGWPYSPGDTADPLIETIAAKAGLAGHFKEHLKSIATLRNKYSTAHGAGVHPKKVTPSIALFGLNLTASAILFLSKEVGLS